MVGAQVVIVGAGSAGAPLAARLSADRGCDVLVLEAGADYVSGATPEEIRGPNFARALALRGFHWPRMQARFTDWQRPRSYVCGRGVGGSSAINGQIAVRGLPEDYDAWAQAECAGWSWEEVLPTFVTLEDDVDFGHLPYHGRNGPLPISRVPISRWAGVSRALHTSVSDAGHPVSDDLNAPGSAGAGPVPWNRRNGRRVSTNDAYLEPSRGDARLRLQPHVLVDRVIFSGSRAVGVVARTADGECEVEAGEVVLCAGAIYSPAILMRSGIGPADEIRSMGTDVIADLPGVGKGLIDHAMAAITVPLSSPAQVKSRHALPGTCLVRLSSDGPEAPSDDIEMLAMDRGLIPSSGALFVSLMYPFSEGRVTLQARDPETDPQVSLRMLADVRDLTRLRDAVRRAARLVRGSAFSGILEGSHALVAMRPVDDYSNPELEAWLRNTVSSHSHALGTCRMGAESNPGSVVDQVGRVFGAECLRVVDASVIPGVLRAPTHLTTVMLAERIAGTYMPDDRGIVNPDSPLARYESASGRTGNADSTSIW